MNRLHVRATRTAAIAAAKIRPIFAQLICVIAIALFFAIISPYGAVTYLGFIARSVYWLLTIAETWIALLMVQKLAGAPVSTGLRAALWGSIAATPVVFVTIVTIQQLIGEPVPTYYWPSLVLSIWLICIATTLVITFVQGREQANEGETREGPDPEKLLRDKMPLPLREAPIYALSAEDHYVAVHTNEGSPLVHMRFRDAMQLMSAEGVQVHRSWWVDKQGVAKVSRQERQLKLVLKSSVEVPVSKSGEKRLRKAGWI